jgi:hypothetical protein
MQVLAIVFLLVLSVSLALGTASLGLEIFFRVMSKYR